MAKFSYFIVIVANLMSFTQCYIRLNLQSRPVPMNNFVPEKLAGRWYKQARFAPCSWAGSKGFTNMARQYDVTDIAFIAKSIYRSGSMCTSTTDERKFSKNNCAVQTTSDNIGNLYSGERIIICTDYKHYLIVWGCMKYNFQNPRKCEDPSVNVQTRDVNPTPGLWKVIDQKLHQFFKFKSAALQRVVHDNPC